MTAYLNALGVICALGRDKSEVARNLFAGDCSGMRNEAGWVAERSLPVAAVRGELAPIPAELAPQGTRNNQLLLEAALQIREDIDQAIQTYGRDRIGIVLGTSTSGIDEASRGLAHYIREHQFPADYDYQQQELGAPANFLADWLQLSGPAYVISTACTSSARALMSAQRLLDLGICDAVLCGGVDSLCKLTLNGFSALEAVSGQRCNPFSVNRNGINIGEAAVLFLMSKSVGDSQPIALLGSGASSDAHHISAPEPTGRGALQAMRKALNRAESAAATDRLPEPARHRHPTQRRHGKPGGGDVVPGGCAVFVDQTHDRPHPRRCRRSGSGVLLVEPECRQSRARPAAPRLGRPTGSRIASPELGDPGQSPDVHCTSLSDEQFLCLRW